MMRDLLRIRLMTMFSILLIGCLFFAYSKQAHTATPAPVMIGQVVWVAGVVKASAPGGKPRDLKRGSAIYEKDTIVTDASGSGQIVFTDSSLVSLRTNSTIQIEQYRYNKNAPGDNSYVASVVKGGFRTITGLISKGNPDAYKVKTPVATIGVRGTMYSISYTPKDGLSVKLDKGAITVTNQSGQLELNQAQNQIYASIASATTRPTLVKKQPAVFNTEPAVVPAPAPAAQPAGGDQTGATTGIGAPASGDGDAGGRGTSGTTGEGGSTGDQSTTDGSSSEAGTKSDSSTSSGTGQDSGAGAMSEPAAPSGSSGTQKTVSGFCIS